MNESEEEKLNREAAMSELQGYVGRKMSASGRCAPEIIMSGLEGLSRMRFENMPTGVDKARFSKIARTACIATGAIAVSFISEVWFKKAKAGEFLDLSKAPSQCPDREEAVIMFMETRRSFEQCVSPILRSSGGNFQGLAHPLEIDVARFTGCFANLLPVQYPSPWERRLAKAALTVQGVKIEDLNEVQKQTAHKKTEERYYVISPDGISLTPEPFPSKKAAREFIPKWCAQYRDQGYYSRGGERIPLRELPKYLHLETETELMRAEGAAVGEQRLEDLHGRSMELMRQFWYVKHG